MRRRNFIASLAVIPAALWPFKAEWVEASPPDAIWRTASEIEAKQAAYKARLMRVIELEREYHIKLSKAFIEEARQQLAAHPSSLYFRGSLIATPTTKA